MDNDFPLLTIEPTGIMLLCPDWVMRAKCAEDGEVSPHEVS